ncbi:hypothetical protein [Nocardia sp. NPDC004860]|uniref:hypothetical protein n=1 Tax=Nocardia sp. NPDC004860 TaxID=3154557 RepID=UPI00339DDAA2
MTRVGQACPVRRRFDPRRWRAGEPAPEKSDETAGFGADGVELSEIVAALHFDLAEWLGSDAPPKVFDRISGALDERFTSVVTTGQAVDREAFLAGIWSARNALAGMEIEVSEVAEVARSGQLIVVRFVAENRVGAARTGHRIVTAVLVTDGRTHLWRTVHETPLPEVPQTVTPDPAASAPAEPTESAPPPAAENDAPQSVTASESWSAVDAGGDLAVGADEESGTGGEIADSAELPGELGSDEEDAAGADEVEDGAAVGEPGAGEPVADGGGGEVSVGREESVVVAVGDPE